MNTQKATYWFALALAAVAFHSEYQRGAFPALHRAANCAGATLCRLATNAERTVAMARLIVSRPTFSSDELLARLDARQLADAKQLAEDTSEMARQEAQDRAELYRDQVRDQVREQVRAQAEMIRAQVERQRSEMERMRMGTHSQVRVSNAMESRVITIAPRGCPQSGVRVTVPSTDLPMIDLPDDEADAQ